MKKLGTLDTTLSEKLELSRRESIGVSSKKKRKLQKGWRSLRRKRHRRSKRKNMTTRLSDKPL
jgi:hypothetical protein